MARRIVFTDSGFWKYSWAHLVTSMTESCRWVMQCRLRARRPQASNKGLRPCSSRTEISLVSLNLLMMLCTVDDEICKAFVIWRWGTLYLKYSTIFLLGVRQSDIQDRYHFDIGLFCWIGVLVWWDRSKFDILHSYYCVIVKPQTHYKTPCSFRALYFKCSEAVT